MVHCSGKDMPMMGLMGIVSHRAVNTAKNMYREFDLNRSQASILFTLHKNESITQKDLAKRLNITAPSITSSIQKMERDGYISREPDKSDQRMMRLALTEKGESCIQSIIDVAERMERIMFEGMSTEEKDIFRQLLVQVNDNLESYERKEKA